MFERFHHDARAAVAHARDEATGAGQHEVGTEHLLLGLLARPGPAADALTAAGASAAGLRPGILRGDAAQPGPPGADADALVSAALDSDAAQRASEGPSAAGSPDRAGRARRAGRDVTEGVRMTSNARRAVELAEQAAERLRHRHVSTGHLLLGVIDQPGSQAVQVLTVAGIHVGTLRADLLRRMEAAPRVG